MWHGIRPGSGLRIPNSGGKIVFGIPGVIEHRPEEAVQFGDDSGETLVGTAYDSLANEKAAPLGFGAWTHKNVI
jgi:hypothetical protein